MSQKYELQAARIESVLSAHKVPARVWQATVTPRFVRFDVTTALGTRLTKVSSLAEELAFSLGAQATRVYREGGVLHVEVPRDTPRTVELLALCGRLSSVPPYCAVLGVDEGGVPLLLRLDSPDVAHVLLAGTTGSGKTALPRTLLPRWPCTTTAGQLAARADRPQGPRAGRAGRAAARLAGGPGRRCRRIAEEAEAAVLLDLLVDEMGRRDAAGCSLPRLVVAIDELADLLQTGGKPVADALTRLTQRGREAGMHVVAATQRPAAALVGGLVKANFPVRLVGSVVSPRTPRSPPGVAGTGAERLLGRGDFLLVAKGQVIRFQAAYAAGGELAGRGDAGAGGRAAAAQLAGCGSGGGAVSVGGLRSGFRARSQGAGVTPHGASASSHPR